MLPAMLTLPSRVDWGSVRADERARLRSAASLWDKDDLVRERAAAALDVPLRLRARDEPPRIAEMVTNQR